MYYQWPSCVYSSCLRIWWSCFASDGYRWMPGEVEKPVCFKEGSKGSQWWFHKYVILNIKMFMIGNPNRTPISLSHGAIGMKVRCLRRAMAEFGLFMQPHKELTASIVSPIPCDYLERESKILLETRIELSSLSWSSTTGIIGLSWERDFGYKRLCYNNAENVAN